MFQIGTNRMILIIRYATYCSYPINLYRLIIQPTLKRNFITTDIFYTDYHVIKCLPEHYQDDCDCTFIGMSFGRLLFYGNIQGKITSSVNIITVFICII